MKIAIKDGLIYSENKAYTDYSGVVNIHTADAIALANGFTFAENFCNKFEGKELEIGPEFKIELITEDF